MKKLFVLPVMLLAMATSCVVPQNLTPEQQHQHVVTRISIATEIVGRRIAASTSDQDKVQGLVKGLSELKKIVQSSELMPQGNLLDSIADLIAEQLSPKMALNVRDGAQLVTLLVGPITVDLSGQITPAQKDYIVAFLDGLSKGLSQ